MEAPAEAQKPKSVGIAVILLWASLAIGLIRALMAFFGASTAAPAGYANLVLVVAFALIAFLIFMISAGKNWARIAFLVLFLVGLLPMLPLILDEFSRSPLVGTLSTAQIVMQVYALFLLFTQPGASWFRKTTPA